MPLPNFWWIELRHGADCAKGIRLYLEILKNFIPLILVEKQQKMEGEIERGSTVRIMQVTNWRECKREDLDIATKVKSEEKN